MKRGTIESLLAYQGISAHPKQADAFWDEALRELDKVAPEAELIPCEPVTPYATCWHLYFTGIGGARIYAKLIRPLKPDGAALLMFHGYRSNSGLWLDKLPYAAAGMTVAAMDCRGQGGKSQDNGQYTGNTQFGHILRGIEDGPQNLLFRRLMLDTVQLARVVSALDGVDASRMAAFGGSQGGGLALACAALYPSLARVAVAYPFLSDYKLVWQTDAGGIACTEMREYFRKFDSRHLREEQFFDTLGYIDIQNMTHRIQAQTLMGTGLQDTVCPPPAQFAAFNRIPAQKKYQLYYDYGHEALDTYLDDVYTFVTGLLQKR